MAKVIGLVLISSTELNLTIPPHEISLIGRPVVEHSVRALSAVCDKVHVERSSTPIETPLQILRRALRQLFPSPILRTRNPVRLLVHDAFQPLLQPQLLRRILGALGAGAVGVATSPSFHGEVLSSQGILRGVHLIEPPVGFRVRELLMYLNRQNDLVLSITALAEAVARANGDSVALVQRNHSGGRLFHNMTADEAEALLRGAPQNRLIKRHRGKKHRVLILGGSGGIGQACIRVLKERKIPYLAPGREVLDLRSEAEYSVLSMVDAVIHSAGAYAASAEEIMAVNFHSCVRLLRAAEVSGWSGSMIFLSSTAATYGRRGAAVYSASKAALNSLVEAQYEYLGRKGIHICAVAPAKVATALQESLNPGTSIGAMIDPLFVAELVIRTLYSSTYGNIIYLRKGEDSWQWQQREERI